MACILSVASCGGATEEGSGPRVVGISGGRRDVCATRDDGFVYCFDTWEQMAGGMPQLVSPMPKATKTAVAYMWGCAIVERGEVWCWETGYGGTTSTINAPVHFPLPAPVKELSCSDGLCSAVSEAGDVIWWGMFRNRDRDFVRPEWRKPRFLDLGGARATQIATNDESSCAVLEDGTVRCWRHGVPVERGRVEPEPVEVVPSIHGVSELVAAPSAMCAITPAEPVKCWGSSVLVSRASRPQIDVPEAIEHLEPASRLATSPDAVCALRTDERVHCFGLAPSNGTQPGPRIGSFSSGLTELRAGATAIAAGGWKACALDRDGVVWCWGKSHHSVPGSPIPVRVPIPR